LTRRVASGRGLATFECRRVQKIPCLRGDFELAQSTTRAPTHVARPERSSRFPTHAPRFVRGAGTRPHRAAARPTPHGLTDTMNEKAASLPPVTGCVPRRCALGIASRGDAFRAAARTLPVPNRATASISTRRSTTTDARSSFRFAQAHRRSHAEVGEGWLDARGGEFFDARCANRALAARPSRARRGRDRGRAPARTQMRSLGAPPRALASRRDARRAPRRGSPALGIRVRENATRGVCSVFLGTVERVAGCSKDTRARPRVFTRVTSPPHPTHPLLSQDDILRRAVAQYKGKNWKKIGACIPLSCTTALFGRPRDRGERRSPGNAQSAPLERATASRFPRRARLARSRALLISPPPPAFHPFFLSRADPPPPPPRLLAWI